MKQNKIYFLITHFLLPIIGFSSFIRCFQCQDDCFILCHENEEHLVIKNVNEKVCSEWCYMRYLLSGEIYNFTCIRCNNTGLESPKLSLESLDGQTKGLQIWKTNENSSDMGIVSNILNDKRGIVLKCTCNNAEESVELLICSRLKRPTIEIVVEPIFSTLDLKVPYLSIIIKWTDVKLNGDKDCRHNYSNVNYQILDNVSDVQTLMIKDTTCYNTTSANSTTCTYESYPICISIFPIGKNSNAIWPTDSDVSSLKLNITGKISTPIVNQTLEIVHFIETFHIETFYRQNITPRIEKCEYTYCTVLISVPHLPEFCTKNKTFEITTVVYKNGLYFKQNTIERTLRTLCNKNSSIMYNITDLPYGSYNFKISYKLKTSIYDNGPYNIGTIQTKATKPNATVFCPPGAYYVTDGVLVIICEKVPEDKQDGPNFQYLLYKNGTMEVTNSVPRFVVNLINPTETTVVLVSCKNSEGNCPKNTSIRIAPNYEKLDYVSAERIIETNKINLNWSKVAHAIFYTVCYCKGQDWYHCEDLNCSKIFSSETTFSTRIQNISDFIFGISVCYKDGCSQMTVASLSRYVSQDKSNPGLWVSLVCSIAALLILMVVGFVCISRKIDKDVKKIIKQFDKMMSRDEPSPHRSYVESKQVAYFEVRKWFRDTFQKTWDECIKDLDTVGISICEHPVAYSFRNDMTQNRIHQIYISHRAQPDDHEYVQVWRSPSDMAINQHRINQRRINQEDYGQVLPSETKKLLPRVAHH